MFRAAEANSEQCAIILKNPKAGEGEPVRSFTFDAVFGQNDTQKHIYDVCAYSMVESVLGGYNGTFFAYGQVCENLGSLFDVMSIQFRCCFFPDGCWEDSYHGRQTRSP